MNDKHTNNGQGELPPEQASIEERSMAMVTAYALDQVTEIERKAVEGLLAASPKLRQHVESIRQLGELLRSSPEGKAEGSPSLRSVLTEKLENAVPPVVVPPPPKPVKDVEPVRKSPNESDRRRWWAWIAGGAIAASFGGGYLVAKIDFSQSKVAYFSPSPASTAEIRAPRDVSEPDYRNTMKEINRTRSEPQTAQAEASLAEYDSQNRFMESSKGFGDGVSGQPLQIDGWQRSVDSVAVGSGGPATDPQYSKEKDGNGYLYTAPSNGANGDVSIEVAGGASASMPLGGTPGASTSLSMQQSAGMGAGGMPSSASGMMGGQAASRGKTARSFFAERTFRQSGGLHPQVGARVATIAAAGDVGREDYYRRFDEEQAGEQYEGYVENPYFDVKDVPLSTFAIDVDTASYANVRRFLNNNQLPPPSAVRTEELLNYFTYSYPGPSDSRPFAVHLEAAECPWNRQHRLVRVGLKGKEIHKAERPSSNLVFLIDTSGSMQSEDKLPLLKSALTLLTRELSAKDRVTIVTYAGDAGLKLPPTSGNDKERIIASLDQLLAGGSTHGSAGITLAYEQAKANFIQEGTNRVILCTDGDLNVGVTSDDALVGLIKEQTKTGVYLSVMGFGTGNLKDGKLEKLADHGNGVYAYIDGLKEARKVFVEQMSGSLVTIAKDVKIQLEFNPKQVQAYRLLGYENRVMENQDFRNDKKDAGEIGAGHTVTALYEIVPASVSLAPTVKLRYQPVAEGRSSTPASAGGIPDDISKELLTVRLRYKNPEATENDPATEFETALANPGATIREASENFRFASAVAMAGLVLRNSQFRGDANLDAAIEIASTSLREDSQGWRAEFIDLLRKAKALQPRVD